MKIIATIVVCIYSIVGYAQQIVVYDKSDIRYVKYLDSVKTHNENIVRRQVFIDMLQAAPKEKEYEQIEELIPGRGKMGEFLIRRNMKTCGCLFEPDTRLHTTYMEYIPPPTQQIVYQEPIIVKPIVEVKKPVHYIIKQATSVHSPVVDSTPRNVCIEVYHQHNDEKPRYISGTSRIDSTHWKKVIN